ncbi:hypothetical protein [Phaffia rhodozyma]|uniref:HAUS augmin-like complex subunit 1 n=1 Tax=Phaffia rhodozyma TaxID=264483 RepID=A0A0F7SQV4_PHARH|nr:hypothetical protein [Phaffia rhodozyma]
MFTPKARLAPLAPSESDSPWTRKLKSSQLSIVQSAFDQAVQDETASHQSIYQHFKSKLPESLILDDDVNLMALTDLCDVLALQPTTITDSAQVRNLVQQGESLNEALLCAQKAQSISQKEGKSLTALKQSLVHLDQYLASTHSATPSTSASQEAAMIDLKCKQYEEEKDKLLFRTQSDSSLSISNLLTLTQTLESVRADKLALRENLAKFKDLPADLDLAALQVEEGRRELAKLESLRDEMKAQTRKLRI